MNHNKCRWGVVTMAATVAVMSAGCVTGREFRTIAGPPIESGVTSILDGLVQGVFAVIQPDPLTGGTSAGSSPGNP